MTKILPRKYHVHSSLYSYKTDYLSLNTTNCVKGLLAVCILLHHIARALPDNSLLSIFQHIGGIVVSLFFFYSGYGLMIQCQTKTDYEKTFLVKRIPTLLIPYIIVTPLYMWICGVDFKEMLINLVYGLPVVNNSWFVIHILLFYIVFWGLMILCKKDVHLMFITASAAIALWVYFTFTNGASLYWYNCSHILILGMIWSIYGEQFVKCVKQNYIFALMSFILFFISFYYLSRIAEGITLYWLRNIMYIMFVLTCLTLLLKIPVQHYILDYLGSISFEIYLIHGFWISYFERLGLSVAVFIFCVISTSFISAVVLSKTDKALMQMIQKGVNYGSR